MSCWGVKPGLLLYTLPESVFEKDMDGESLLFCSWEQALHLHRGRAWSPVAQPQCSVEEAASPSPLPKLGAARSVVSKVRAILTCLAEQWGCKSALLPRLEFPPSPSWVSGSLPGAGSLITAPLAHCLHPGLETPCGEPGGNIAGHLHVRDQPAFFYFQGTPDCKRSVHLINTCQRVLIWNWGRVLTYPPRPRFHCHLMQHQSLLPVPAAHPRNQNQT